MTLTKTQKMRRKMGKKKTKVSRKDFNFLNGNTLSLNLKKKKKLGRQSVRRVAAPVAKSFQGGNTRASIVQRGSGVTEVRHSEYITDVGANMDFSVDAIPINPGTSNLFPWLSSIATRYESYRFKELCFRYETTAPTSTPGTVVLTIDYNPQAVPPVNKAVALAAESAIRTAPWTSISHRSLPHNLNKRKSYYIRQDGDQGDPDLYDVGLFMIATDGVPTDSGSIGEVHVDYTIELLTPTLSNQNASGPSVLIEASSPTDPDNYAYLTEEDITYDPEGTRDFIVGPHINVDATEGAPGNIGAMRFETPGLYLVTHMFTSNGLTLPGSWANWSIGIDSNLETGSAFPGGYLNVVPGDGDLVVIDISANKVTSTNIVSVTGAEGSFILFGIGSNLARDPMQTGSVQTSIMVAPYFNQTVPMHLSLREELKPRCTGRVFLNARRSHRPRILQKLYESERGRRRSTKPSTEKGVGRVQDDQLQELTNRMNKLTLLLESRSVRFADGAGDSIVDSSPRKTTHSRSVSPFR